MPFCPALTVETVSVADVAPEIVLNDVAPGASNSHCTDGAGLPEAAAVKVALTPLLTAMLAGWVVTAAAKSTLRVAAVLVAVPTELVNTASYLVPFCAATVLATARVGDVAPEIELNDVAPGASDCHCTVAAGLAEAAAVNVAV